MIVGNGDFADAINTAFAKNRVPQYYICGSPTESADIAVDLAMNGISARLGGKLPVVYPFDFIEGGAAMVVLPDDKVELEAKGDVRLCAAKYMSGYCAFGILTTATGCALYCQGLSRANNPQRRSKQQPVSAPGYWLISQLGAM